MKGKYEKGLKKVQKVQRQKKNKIFQREIKYQHHMDMATKIKIIVKKKIRILQNQVHQVNQYSILNQIK